LIKKNKWTGRDLNPRSDARHAPILPD